MANRFTRSVMRIKTKDILAPVIFLLILIPSLIFKLINRMHRRKLWLVAEDGEARDNGYHFYKYVREKHPTDFCFYAVKLESAGYEKIEKLGNVIKYGSLKHWFYYMSANLNISSQKSGNPAPIFWYILHVKLGLYKNRVFLQHGVTKDDSKWIYYRQTKFKYFVCGAKPEYDYILKKFGYKKKSLLFTGFPRWDSLRDASKKQKHESILIMPTWRSWLGGDRNSLFDVKNFRETDFYKYWNGLLNDQDFIDILEKNSIEVYFYPHINMMKFINAFKTRSKKIKFVSAEYDIQNFLNKCNLMITDYSSVAFDFAYLRKPVIYYQFDTEEYRKNQYQEGYFNYKDNGFGDVLLNKKTIMNKIEYYVRKNFRMETKYLGRADNFFSFRDTCNCKRVYEAIK